MHRTNAVVETGMQRTGINQVCKSELFNAPQPLKIRMFDQIENEIARDINKSVYRIIDDFSFICRYILQSRFFTKIQFNRQLLNLFKSKVCVSRKLLWFFDW